MEMHSSIENDQLQELVIELLNDFIDTFSINDSENKDKIFQFSQKYKVIETNKNKKNIFLEQIPSKEKEQENNMCKSLTKKGTKCKNKVFKDSFYCKLHNEVQENNKILKKKITEKKTCEHIFIKGSVAGEKCTKLCSIDEKYCYSHKKK